MALQIGRYGDVLKTSCFNVLRTSLGDLHWGYIGDRMGTCIGSLLGTSSGRSWDVILPTGCLFLKLIKNIFVYDDVLFHDGVLCHKETSPLICFINEWTSFYIRGTSTMNDLTKKVKFCYQVFCTADKLNTFKLLKKSTISPKRIMVLCCVGNYEQF